MPQILPKFEDITFSNSKNVYEKPKSRESVNLFEVKKEGAVIAFFHAILNKLFGSKTITQRNIEIVTSCALKNIDKMELTTEHLIEARKITNQMQEILPENKSVKKLSAKIDAKIVLLNKSKFYDALPKDYTSHQIADQIKCDSPRASDCFFNQKPLMEQTNYNNDFSNISLETKAVVLANCQFFEPQRNAVGYGFNLNFFTEDSAYIPLQIKREYSIINSNTKDITVAVKTSWALPNRELLSVDHDIKFDVSKINDIFDNPNSDHSNAYPVSDINIKNTNIIDQEILDRTTG